MKKNIRTIIKLNLIMGWVRDPGPGGSDARFYPPNWYWMLHRSGPGWYHALGLPDPFTHATAEREVFRFVMRERFSIRQKFWRELRDIIVARLDAKNAAWPDLLMFAKDGDMARAALKVLK